MTSPVGTRVMPPGATVVSTLAARSKPAAPLVWYSGSGTVGSSRRTRTGSISRLYPKLPRPRARCRSVLEPIEADAVAPDRHQFEIGAPVEHVFDCHVVAMEARHVHHDVGHPGRFHRGDRVVLREVPERVGVALVAGRRVAA